MHAASMPGLQRAEEQHPDGPDGAQQCATVAPDNRGGRRHRNHWRSADLQREPQTQQEPENQSWKVEKLAPGPDQARPKYLGGGVVG